MNKVYAILLVAVSNLAIAQRVDLELEANFVSSDSVFEGFVGEFSLTLTNNGPDDIPGTFIISPIVNDSGYFFSPDDSVTQPNCISYYVSVEPRPPLNQGGTILVFEPTPLSSGQSITCYGIYTVSFQSGVRSFTWETFGFSQGIIVEDPFPENNFAFVELIVPVQPVDTLNLNSLLMLISFMLFVGIKHRVCS